ncbi:hypothetical protein FA15DRAFT_636920 [Coprinopsis marcescibilis]|uniref:Methyltransferase domain-containing protein n=1 Tax=Coprinopsis marcescibilis TaxID=230819 RepID=A0A5C3L2M2_COPMA|nr:hypothetical protein FA15DRAFT_636920 [Coprinopsis marcescibilis]
MEAFAKPRPQSQRISSLNLSASLQFEVYQDRISQLQPKRPAVRSHYRPFSTLFVEESPVGNRNSVLVKPRRQSTIQRSASLTTVHSMGLRMKKSPEKGAKEKAKELPKLRIRKMSDGLLVSTSPSVTIQEVPSPSPSSKSPITKGVSRTGMSGGQAVAERSAGNGKTPLHKVKAQRSMAALFSTVNDMSPNVASSDTIPRSKSVVPIPSNPLPPTSFRASKLDVVDDHPPPASNRSGRFGKVDGDGVVSKKKGMDSHSDNNVWLTRSKTKVHPYTGEAPYLQAYDRVCLDNDRYSDLLLRRLNPSSPSFFKYGKKPPLTVLDLGCGQGHWVLWAASMWKNSRITGLDLVDITLPAFQTTENVNFVRGNFLFKLPFPAKSFEYVRMSNLSLCIPYNKWLPLLEEVKRILTNGGRLELVDDQLIFPYGEEPKIRELSKSEPSQGGMSFFDFHDDSDDDTLEEAGSTTTSSTLVSERGSSIFDKLPGSKRNSAQSDRSDRVVTIVSANGLPPSSRDVLPSSPTEAHPPSPVTTDASQYPISPSPTITQASMNSLDETASMTTSVTFTQSSADKGHKRHRKSGSSSSTRSQSEAVSSWREKKELSLDMETIFEYLLINKCGIHPRPSDFVQDSLRRVFGKGNAGKIRSYHVKLAPYDSPIGPGGTMSTSPIAMEHPVRLEKEVKPIASSSDQLKRHWKQISEKKEKKDRKIDRKGTRELDGASLKGFEEHTKPIISAKAASRLGVEPTTQGIPPKRASADFSTSDSSGSEGAASSYRSNSFSTPRHPSGDKAADRLGISSTIPPPVPPKTGSALRISDAHSGRPSSSRSSTSPAVPVKAANRLGIETRALSRSFSSDRNGLGTYQLSPTTSMRSGSKQGNASNPSLPTSQDNSSDSNLSSSSEQSVSETTNLVSPPILSAKAAGRLGISYSVLAAASAAHSRASGAMAPVQSPGLLVWPSTYLPMSPTELEMHTCKSLQTLLACRHALKEHITAEFAGKKIADDEDFEDAIWEYESFRRSRFHWPNDNPELFAEQGFPEPPSPTAPCPPSEGELVRKPGAHSRHNSIESFNGQYKRDELTHVRTIRVFEAVKAIDEKGFVSMLFSGSKPGSL